jgi:DNA-binding transcriptional ArsR family regulator
MPKTDIVVDDVAHAEMASDAKIASMLAAFGNNERLKLWQVLLPYGIAGLPGGTIAARTAIPASDLSFHLKRMTDAGIVTERRCNGRIIYAANVEFVTAIIQRLPVLLLQPNAGPTEIAKPLGQPTAPA